MNKRSLYVVAATTLISAASLGLGGCIVARTPAVYSNYGYATVAAPNTVYYRGGNYGGVYYRPGYYVRNAPFIAQPTYVRPTYVQPTYVRPRPVYYQQPGVVVSGQVGGGYGGGTVIVR